ncbi:MAG: hypothetical protein WC998_01285 [Candidatus Paceibacterota bacterium]|jgi:hypothetical protein
MPPKPGGMNDQDYKDTIENEFLDRVYSIILKWKRGKASQDEQKLILWLSKEGLMAK